MATVYKITNIQNSKIYVGVTSRDIKIRYSEHKKHSKRTNINNMLLYDDMKKYGINNFIIDVLEVCENDKMYERERYWIIKLETTVYGYNKYICIDYVLAKDILLKTLSITETAKILNCDRSNLLKFAHNENIYNMMIDKEIQYQLFSNKVFGITKDSKILYFDSTLQASKFCITEFNAKGKAESIQSHIADVCKGKRKSAYGVVWKYL